MFISVAPVICATARGRGQGFLEYGRAEYAMCTSNKGTSGCAAPQHSFLCGAHLLRAWRWSTLRFFLLPDAVVKHGASIGLFFTCGVGRSLSPMCIWSRRAPAQGSFGRALRRAGGRVHVAIQLRYWASSQWRVFARFSPATVVAHISGSLRSGFSVGASARVDLAHIFCQ